MLHLLQGAVDPDPGLGQCLENWYGISCALREPPRKRALQVEKFAFKDFLLS
jgi:hypothetical protein